MVLQFGDAEIPVLLGERPWPGGLVRNATTLVRLDSSASNLVCGATYSRLKEAAETELLEPRSGPRGVASEMIGDQFACSLFDVLMEDIGATDHDADKLAWSRMEAQGQHLIRPGLGKEIEDTGAILGEPRVAPSIHHRSRLVGVEPGVGESRAQLSGQFIEFAGRTHARVRGWDRRLGLGTGLQSSQGGEGGVPMGSLFTRLLFAIKYQEQRIVLSNLINSESKILFNRPNI